MEIKVLGPGCANCARLHDLATAAVGEIGMEATVLKVTDIMEITRAGILSTPGLVINGKMKHSGKPLPSPEKLMELIREEM